MHPKTKLLLQILIAIISTLLYQLMNRNNVSNFVQKCEEFRKELLETGRDTGHIGPPDAGTVEKYAVQKGSVNGVYEESWHVADNYCLRIILYVNKDFIEL